MMLDQLAAETFPEDKFVHVRDVPVFAEHETTDKEGKPKRYTKTELEQIIAKCNSRISDTNDFAVLTEGHTPDRDDLVKGAKNPDILGFVGPFKLGRIGRDKPRYAILADEWHFKDVHDRVSKLPRRSVELWMGKEPFFDPIAALGAETPRLDLGLKFARLPNGEQVEKYMAAMPAESNTFVPSDKKESYMAPEEMAELMENIMQLPPMQWAQQQMEAAQSTPPPTAPPPQDNSGPNEAYEADNPDDSPPMPTDSPDEKKDSYEAGEDNEDYRCGGPQKMAKQDSDPIDEKVQYRKLQAENEQYKERFSRMEERLVKFEREAADARRESRLENLGRELLIDVDKEKERCLYSKGANMSDAAFNQHIEMIAEYAQPNIEGRTLPEGELREQTVSYQREADKAEKAVKYADAERRKKNVITYEMALAEVEKQTA